MLRMFISSTNFGHSKDKALVSTRTWSSAVAICSICFIAMPAAHGAKKHHAQRKPPAHVQHQPIQYQTLQTVDERIHFCVNAINNKTIRKGMSLAQLDAIFGTKTAIDTQQRDKPFASAYIPLGPDEEGAWHFTYYFDHSGKVLGYALSNSGSYQPHRGKMDKDFAKYLGNQFDSLRSDDERLTFTIDAMNRGLLYAGEGMSRVKKVFGDFTDREPIHWGPKPTLFVRSKPLSGGPDAWRLFIVARHDKIVEYFITNLNSDPWAESDSTYMSAQPLDELLEQRGGY